jgi:hypothetical protein
MTTGINRRQFERLVLSDEAVAVDKDGAELGKVSQAGGGGMLIQAHSAKVADSLSIGRKLQITVIETKLQTSHTIDVVVRHREGNYIGVEFVTGQQKA